MSLDEKKVAVVKMNLAVKTTDELLEIVASDDLARWSSETVEAARLLIQERVQGLAREAKPPFEESDEPAKQTLPSLMTQQDQIPPQYDSLGGIFEKVPLRWGHLPRLAAFVLAVAAQLWLLLPVYAWLETVLPSIGNLSPRSVLSLIALFTFFLVALAAWTVTWAVFPPSDQPLRVRLLNFFRHSERICILAVLFLAGGAIAGDRFLSSGAATFPAIAIMEVARCMIARICVYSVLVAVLVLAVTTIAGEKWLDFPLALVPGLAIWFADWCLVTRPDRRTAEGPKSEPRSSPNDPAAG